MAPPLLTLQDIHLTFGGAPLLEGVELSLSKHDRLALVGRNGSGKSVLLQIVSGGIEPDRGDIFVQPGTTIRYLPQEPDLSGFSSTLDYVRDGLAPGDDEHRASYLLEQLGLDGSEDPATLSGGEIRRAALVRAIAPEPDILLLDEPTNHLDLPAIEWLENTLAASRSAIILISHDRRLLQTISKKTLWIDRGSSRSLNQGFSGFEAWRDEMLRQEEEDRHKLDRKIVREEHWIRYGVTARRKRNQRRLQDLHGLRQKRRTDTGPVGQVKMQAEEATQSGKLVVEVKSISKTYGDRDIVRDFSTRIQRGDRVGIVGPNGAGKTTLLDMLVSKLAPDQGIVKPGHNIEMVKLEQDRGSLDPEMTLRDALTFGAGDTVAIGDSRRHVIAHMKDFLFAPEQAGSPLHTLSGGERGRVMLARAFSKPSNLMVLDEPTNDLDLETLDLLQELLGDYAGTILLVSHDRDFLDRVVTSVISPNGDGTWLETAGGYGDLEAQGAKLAQEKKAKSSLRKQKSGAAASKEKKQTKLSFREQHLLDGLPARIEELQDQIRGLEGKLSEAGFFDNDPDVFAKTSEKLTNCMSELSEAEENWIELEMKRETLAGTG
ncbi:MAG: ATP-binding cassette domain-containing protein [Rhizobiales bacterium]|nr:ATP-binding cassette domain-containing protein [Hyphomicrobiales bacterium]